MLGVFWLRRFLFVLAVALAGLLVVEYARRGEITELGTIVGWSVAAAVLAASISTYWAYRIRCRVMFDRDPTELPRKE